MRVCVCGRGACATAWSSQQISCHVMDVAGVLQVGREVDHCDRQREASCAGRYARCRVSRVGGHGVGGPSARAQHALKTLSNTKF